MTKPIDTAAATGARQCGRVADAHRWLARAWASIRTAATDHSVQWQSTLLSRRKLTHPSEVMKMREPVRPTTRATWYR
jgi:hypothetical protein